MALDLADYEHRAREAVKAFWGNRAAAIEKQKLAGKIDQGERAGVTGGKNMDGFLTLLVDLVERNGLRDAEVHLGSGLIDYNQKITIAAMQIADINVWAHLS